jgi:hypothetical protein
MKTILLLHDESGSPKPRFQNVACSKAIQRASEGTPGCNCDRWGHPVFGPCRTLALAKAGLKWIANIHEITRP